jgi:hypothetical protein
MFKGEAWDSQKQLPNCNPKAKSVDVERSVLWRDIK